jgi:hypothetical protein
MWPMKKWLAVRLLLLIVVAVPGFLLLAWWTAPTNLITREDSRRLTERLRVPMTQEEVTEILGSPGEEPSEKRATILAQHHQDQAGQLKWRIWVHKEEGSQPLAVAFDEEGNWKVMTYVLPPTPPGLLQKIRRWFRLS